MLERMITLADQIHASVYDANPDWFDLADAAEELARLMAKHAQKPPKNSVDP